MYIEEKLYNIRSLVVVHILNFQRGLVVMRFICIELMICSTNKVDTYFHCYTVHVVESLNYYTN